MHGPETGGQAGRRHAARADAEGLGGGSEVQFHLRHGTAPGGGVREEVTDGGLAGHAGDGQPSSSETGQQRLGDAREELGRHRCVHGISTGTEGLQTDPYR